MNSTIIYRSRCKPCYTWLCES